MAFPHSLYLLLLEFAIGFDDFRRLLGNFFHASLQNTFVRPILSLSSPNLALCCSTSRLSLDDAAAHVKPLVVLAASTVHAASCI